MLLLMLLRFFRRSTRDIFIYIVKERGVRNKDVFAYRHRAYAHERGATEPKKKAVNHFAI